MKIKTVQWNIGGGRTRDLNADSIKIASYSNDGIDYIVKILKKINPDVITLQETHANKKSVQAQIIADKLNLKYLINDVYANSHIDDQFKLGQAVISRFPIADHKFKFFYNPKIKLVGEDGDIWISHDKGISNCKVTIAKDKKIEVATMHMIPFRKFSLDPSGPSADKIRKDLEKKVQVNFDKSILQGDFNFDNASVVGLLPKLFKDEAKEVKQSKPTTPKGYKYDHVVYKGMISIGSKVIDNVLTDHYPIVSEFEI